MLHFTKRFIRIKKNQKSPTFGKLVTGMLIFTAANTFSQLNQVFIADSRTGLFRTPLKTRVKPQKQSLELLCRRMCS